MATELKYLYGFGAHLQSEARPGALPLAQNNPLRCPDGLYAEQLSGSAFTVPRAGNCRAWLYRILPSVTLGRFRAAPQRAKYIVAPTEVTPERLRWRAMDYPNEDEVVDFVSGLRAVAGQGDPADRDGMCIYLYAANASMQRTCFSNADGDFLVVPQAGGLRVDTEFGKMDVEPGSIFVVPRGIRFRIALHSEKARGYVCEVFDGHFELPDLGVIGSNGLASPRDFRYPTAWYEIDPVGDFEIVTKFQGRIFTAQDTHSPFNVVAWHGNYAPYSYDLSRFCPVTSVLFDHMDPSIFTVLTCKSKTPGVALVDFVIFPPRWMSQEHTFRPPYFHRNCMTEYMGLIRGSYDAKGAAFAPGSSSLHSIGSPHGPDTESYVKAVSIVEQTPTKVGQEDLAFMFETCKMVKLTEWAMHSPHLDTNYVDSWQGLPTNPIFDPTDTTTNLP